MGNSVQVSPQALRTYGNTAAGISSRLAASGAFDLAANLAEMAPVFGLIGQDFLAAFAVAQANFAKSYGDVATVFGGRAQLAHHSAAAYESTDRDHAERLDAIVKKVS